MKKFIAILLAVVLTLSLAACGGKTEAPSAENAEAASTETITLKMHFVDPETAPYVKGGQKIAELVKEATNGRIEIEVMAGGSLGGGGSDYTTNAVERFYRFLRGKLITL